MPDPALRSRSVLTAKRRSVVKGGGGRHRLEEKADGVWLSGIISGLLGLQTVCAKEAKTERMVSADETSDSKVGGIRPVAAHRVWR